MAKNEKFKVLSNEELEKMSKDEIKEYRVKLKEYKKSLKINKSSHRKRSFALKVAAVIMATIMILGVIASIIYPLLALNK